MKQSKKKQLICILEHMKQLKTKMINNKRNHNKISIDFMNTSNLKSKKCIGKQLLKMNKSRKEIKWHPKFKRYMRSFNQRLLKFTRTPFRNANCKNILWRSLKKECLTLMKNIIYWGFLRNMLATNSRRELIKSLMSNHTNLLFMANWSIILKSCILRNLVKLN